MKHSWEGQPLAPGQETRLLSRGGTVHRALAKHPDLSTEGQLALAESEDLLTILGLVWRDDLTLQVQRILLRKGPFVVSHLAVVADVELQREILKAGETLETLAKNPHLDHDVYQALLEASLGEDGVDIACALAEREDLPRSWQEKYLASTNPDVEYAVKTGGALDADLQETHGIITPASVPHPDEETTPADLQRYVEHPYEDVRKEVAMHPKLNGKQQLALLGDTLAVRYRLAINPSLTLRCAKALTKSVPSEDTGIDGDYLATLLVSHPRVRGSLRKTLLRKKPRAVKGLAQNPTTPDEILLQLTEDERCHEVLASRGNLPEKVEKILQQSSSDQVLGSLARSTKNPDTLHHLAREGGWFSRSEALQNPYYPWSGAERVGFAHSHNPIFLEDYRYQQGADPETWDALLPTWRGTIDELVEACTLV